MTTASSIRAALSGLLGEAALSSEEERQRYGLDALGSNRGFSPATDDPAMPLAVVHPATADDVAAVLRVAGDHGVPVVPYGGGTGLMGGARTLRPGIVLEMSRMAAVREVDVDAGWVWAEAGATLASVDAALRVQGLMLGHDPWTFAIASVGGAVSTNGLGFLGGKYGSMGDQVLAIEAVLADGTVIRTRPASTGSTGFDTRHLFIGTEGAYGVLTAVCARAFPIPESRTLAGFHFERFEQGFGAILAMQRIGLTPTVLDYGDRPGVEPPALYCGFDGFAQEVEAGVSRTSELCIEAGGSLMDTDEVDEFWDSRHLPAENFARRRAQGGAARSPLGDDGCFDYVHVALPASALLRYRHDAMAIAADRDVRVLETGVWVRPGLFSLVLANRGRDREAAVEQMAQTVDACLRLAHERGGSMEYCHGVGVRLAHLMDEEHGTALGVLRSLKRTIDPDGLLNPGKFGLD